MPRLNTASTAASLPRRRRRRRPPAVRAPPFPRRASAPASAIRGSRSSRSCRRSGRPRAVQTDLGKHRRTGLRLHLAPGAELLSAVGENGTDSLFTPRGHLRKAPIAGLAEKVSVPFSPDRAQRAQKSAPFRSRRSTACVDAITQFQSSQCRNPYVWPNSCARLPWPTAPPATQGSAAARMPLPETVQRHHAAAPLQLRFTEYEREHGDEQIQCGHPQQPYVGGLCARTVRFHRVPTSAKECWSTCIDCASRRARNRPPPLWCAHGR